MAKSKQKTNKKLKPGKKTIILPKEVAVVSQKPRVDLPPAISPNDPLRRYMMEVQRYPLLEPEEEIALAKRMHEKGDATAAKMLISANLRLVVKIAYEYKNYYTNLLDLIQEGNIGLMKAVSKFDPSKGARVGYYASWWIRSYILKYLIDNFRLVKIGTTQAQKKLFFHLMREKERLEAQGLAAGPKLLAQKLDVKEKEVEEMQNRLTGGGAELSLDSPMNSKSSGGFSEEKGSFVELLPAEGEMPDESLAHEELLRKLKKKLPSFRKTLNAKEMKILEDRILSDEPKTLQEVADQYSLTRERVRQLETKIIQKFKAFLAKDIDI